jgi:hypothetical protein
MVDRFDDYSARSSARSFASSRSLPDIGSSRSGKHYPQASSRSDRESRRSSRHTARSNGSDTVRSRYSAGGAQQRASAVESAHGHKHAGWTRKGELDPHWRAQPRYKTVTEMKEARRQAMKPHPTFDVDGDGVVSSTDFYLSNRFDENGDGELQDTERHHLRKKMVEETIAKYRSLPKAKGRETEELIKSFTKNIDKTVDDPDFVSKY